MELVNFVTWSSLVLVKDRIGLVVGVLGYICRSLSEESNLFHMVCPEIACQELEYERRLVWFKLSLRDVSFI